MQDTAFVGQLILGLVLLSSAALNFVNLFRINRRNPPMPEEIAKTYATKQDLDRVIARMETIQRDFAAAISELRRDQNKDSDELLRAIGRIEGEFKKCPYLCKAGQ